MNAQTKINMPLTREAQMRAEIAAVRQRFHAEWQKLSADMQLEISRIERRYWFR